MSIKGKLIRKGMSEEEVFKAMNSSEKWEYIASGEGWFWFRHIASGDVIEVRFEDSVYADIDIL